MSEVKVKHASLVLQYETNLWQAVCACGWSSSIDYYEAVDLLRAMHAHAVVTFQTYA